MKNYLCLFFLFVYAPNVWAQEPLKLYFSQVNSPYFSYEHLGYLKQSLPNIGFVSGPSECDVQVLMIYENGFQGIWQGQLVFIGKKEFEGQRDTLFFTNNSTESIYSRRQKIVEVLKKGFLPYLLQKGLYDQLSFNEKKAGKNFFEAWDANLFGVSGNGDIFFHKRRQQSYNSEEHTKRFSSDINLRLNYTKTTLKRYFYSGVYISQDYSQVTSMSNGVVEKETNRMRKFNSFFGFSQRITDHFRVGIEGTGSFLHSGQNVFDFNPQLQYSFLPYNDWFFRRIVVNYELHYSSKIDYSSYGDNHFTHNISAIFFKRKPWGNFSIFPRFAYRFVDKYWDGWETSFHTNLSLELGKGFFLDTHFGVNYTNMDYSVVSYPPLFSKKHRVLTKNANIGISYWMGTKWRSAVNPIPPYSY